MASVAVLGIATSIEVGDEADGSTLGVVHAAVALVYGHVVWQPSVTVQACVHGACATWLLLLLRTGDRHVSSKSGITVWRWILLFLVLVMVNLLKDYLGMLLVEIVSVCLVVVVACLIVSADSIIATACTAVLEA